jgi:hypothetical protein
MSDITAFLLARIAEREQAARNRVVYNDTAGVTLLSHDRSVTLEGFTAQSLRLSVGYPDAELLAECKAKRRIVERHSSCGDVSDGDPSSCPDIRDLAAIHADHPDYREEWRA